MSSEDHVRRARHQNGGTHSFRTFHERIDIHSSRESHLECDNQSPYAHHSTRDNRSNEVNHSRIVVPELRVRHHPGGNHHLRSSQLARDNHASTASHITHDNQYCHARQSLNGIQTACTHRKDDAPQAQSVLRTSSGTHERRERHFQCFDHPACSRHITRCTHHCDAFLLKRDDHGIRERHHS